MNTHSSQRFDLAIVVMLSVLTGYAIFAYGLTTDATRQNFDIGLGVILVVWLIGLIVQRRKPSVPKVVFILSMVLLLFGWLSVWNAKLDHSWEGGTGSWRTPDLFSIGGVSWLPGTINQGRSLSDMIHLSLLIPGGWVVCDVCRYRGSRRLLLEVFVCLGLAFAVLGLFLKASGENSIYFSFKDGPTWRGAKSFASYRYHGNAATLLNFIWPTALGLFLANLLKQNGSVSRTVFACAAFFTFAALFVNTSKLGHITAPILLVLFAVCYRKKIKILCQAVPHKRLIGVIFGVIAIIGFSLMATLTFSQSAERWADFDGSANGRLTVYQVCLTMVKKAGVFGMGPGTFSTAFPYYLADANKQSDFFYYQAHQDYLQGLIEWGWLGFTGWIALLSIVFAKGVTNVRAGSFYSAALLIAILSTVLQAFVDFPAQIASLQWVGVLLCGVLISPMIKVPVDSYN